MPACSTRPTMTSTDDHNDNQPVLPHLHYTTQSKYETVESRNRKQKWWDLGLYGTCSCCCSCGCYNIVGNPIERNKNRMVNFEMKAQLALLNQGTKCWIQFFHVIVFLYSALKADQSSCTNSYASLKVNTTILLPLLFL